MFRAQKNTATLLNWFRSEISRTGTSSEQVSTYSVSGSKKHCDSPEMVPVRTISDRNQFRTSFYLFCLDLSRLIHRKRRVRVRFVRVRGTLIFWPTQRPSEPAIQRISDPAIQRVSDSAIRRPRDSAIQRPSDSATQRPSDSANQRFSESAIQRVSDSAT